MIQDFINANSIDAKVVSFQNETPIRKVILLTGLTDSSFAKAVPFVDEKMNFFVLIKLANEESDILTAEDLFNKNLNDLDSKSVEKFTGFKKNYFPPISVFGVEVKLTLAAKKQKKLLFALSENEYLIIDVDEIKKAQELS